MTATTPTKIPATKLKRAADGNSPKCRAIFPPRKGGWSEPAIFEWELAAEAWTDMHPHGEYNVVVEGQLFVEAGGVTVEANPGDAVHVAAGVQGRYWAPEYARMFTAYGPSAGDAGEVVGYERLEGFSAAADP